jgi:transglutaminase-like putative cysteine protease
VSAREQRRAQDQLPGLIDEREVDWPRVASVSYLVQQRFRYRYSRPIHALRHRLMVVPPDRHGDQRTVASHVGVSAAVSAERRTDEHGNVCVEFVLPRVEAFVEFEARIVVSRTAAGEGSDLHEADRLTDRRLLDPTPLTAPTPALARAARRLGDTGARGPELAEAANAWTHRALEYRRGVTAVHTTAAGALAAGGGVCQDFAHVMLALCRLLELPARYVSGHLLGEGGTHAWVEVLLPDPAGSGLAAAFPFDPTHGGTPGLTHVTVATGRDYRDVAPTSGTYTGAATGRLSASKRVDIIGVDHARGRSRTA